MFLKYTKSRFWMVWHDMTPNHNVSIKLKHIIIQLNTYFYVFFIWMMANLWVFSQVKFGWKKNMFLCFSTIFVMCCNEIISMVILLTVIELQNTCLYVFSQVKFDLNTPFSHMLPWTKSSFYTCEPTGDAIASPVSTTSPIWNYHPLTHSLTDWQG